MVILTQFNAESEQFDIENCAAYILYKLLGHICPIGPQHDLNDTAHTYMSVSTMMTCTRSLLSLQTAASC